MKLILIIALILSTALAIYTILSNIFTKDALSHDKAFLSGLNNEINMINSHSSKVDQSPNVVYTFDNPLLAYYILKELYFDYPTASRKSSLHHKRLKFIKEVNYCDRAVQLFVDHPELVFLDKNIFTDYNEISITRDLIKSIGKDIPPKAYYFAPRHTQKPFYFSPQISLFFITEYLHEHLIIGQHFACSHQLYNKMLRLKGLGNKADVAQNYENYLAKFKDGRKHCAKRYLPESYLLDNQTQCVSFFNYIQTTEHEKERMQQGIVFIKKEVGKHMGSGLALVDELEEFNLLKLYENGTLCGKLPNQQLQLQRYITNPLLLYGHKFDFRVYMLVASVNPLIVYYHDGFLRVSLQIYDPDSKLKTTHFTNTHLAEVLFKQAQQDGTWNGMTEQELRDFQSWNFTRLQNYLLQVKKINDVNWIENGLKHQLQLAFIHILRATQHSFMKRSNIYHLWGMDFVLDDDLNLWFIEANTRPALKGSSSEKRVFVNTLLRDHFNLMFAHLRSRIKSVILYVNKLIKEIPNLNFMNEGVIIPNIEKRRKEFALVNRNYMDPEFDPHQSSFIKVIDDNFEGIERYNGLLPKECIKF